MLAQQKIILKKHKNLVGNTISVIVDEKDETGSGWLGRTYGDAPDVDSKVIIQENHLKVGDIKNMMITGDVKGAKEDLQ
jgi:ribosomal protein S12 methylthiotransferase